MTLRLALCAAAIAMPLHARAATPVFTPGVCPAAAMQAVVPITCGTVAVPENRANPAGRSINIAVMIARTPVRPRAPDPIVIAAGGPDAEIDTAIALLSMPGAAGLLGNRNLIVFDYRGFGYSTPNLTCAANAKGHIDVPDCIAHLRRTGADLAGYTTRQVTADLHDIRLALHLPAMNVWGTSYGTRVAMTLDRDYPADLRSMILDGPFPLQATRGAREVVETASGVVRLTEACGANHACGHAFPDLARRYDAAIPRIDRRPLTVDGVPQTGDQLLDQLVGAQSSIADLPLLPAVMDEVVKGTLTTLAPLGLSAAQESVSPPPAQTLLLCNSAYYSPDGAALSALLGTDPIVTGFARATLAWRKGCREWPFIQRRAGELRPLRSATPALIFSGQYDPSQGWPEAVRTAATLSDARITEFPGYAHVALGNGPCPVVIAQEFLASLTPKTVDASCTRSLPQPAWVTILPR